MKLSLKIPMALVLAAVAVPAVPASDKVAGVLSVRDALTSPGRPVTLEARLVRAGMLGQGQGLGGEQIEFSVAGRSVGTGMTGGDGRVLLEYTPRMRGNQEITARLLPNKRVESEPAGGTLFSWERRRPILLVEVAVLLQAPKSSPPALPGLPLELGTTSAPTAVPEAAEELKRLSDYFYNVIYLSWSETPGLTGEDELRAWLRQSRFPPGPAVRLTGGPPALHRRLDALRDEGWDNLKAGIGRTRPFAEVLAERRLPVIVIPQSEREQEKLPRKTAVVKDWKEVRRKLQG